MSETMKDKENNKIVLPVIMLLLFLSVGVVLWLTRNNIFYLFNFGYIGISLSAAVYLFQRRYKNARKVSMLLIGLYMLVFLGFIKRENMQIEGFWYYLFSGTFEAAVIHYLVAKIAGPLIFGRGWCGYACWTAMVLDFLPFKKSGGRRKGLGWIRYAVFISSLLFTAAVFILDLRDKDRIMFLAFVVGNVIYYITGITLAFVFRDNRAFCKYICPVTVFLKPVSRYSLIRIKCDSEKCVGCGKCRDVCPMDVDMLDLSRNRKNGTECILCMECVRNCPKGAL